MSGFNVKVYTEQVFDACQAVMMEKLNQQSQNGTDAETIKKETEALNQRFEQVSTVINDTDMQQMMENTQGQVDQMVEKKEGTASFSLEQYTQNVIEAVHNKVAQQFDGSDVQGQTEITNDFQEMQTIMQSEDAKSVMQTMQGQLDTQMGVATEHTTEQQQTQDVQNTQDMSQDQRTVQEEPETWSGNLKNAVTQYFQEEDGSLDWKKTGVFFAEAVGLSAIASKVTGNKLLGTAIGVVAPVLLQKLELLPDGSKSMQEYVDNLKGVFDGTYAKEEASKDMVVEQQSQNINALHDISNSTNELAAQSVDGVGVDGVTDLKNQMASCGADMAGSGVFTLTSHMDSQSLSALKEMSTGTMSVFEQKVDNLAGEDGILTEEYKKDVVAELKNLHDGYAAYSDAANAKLQELYGDNPETLSQAQLGLEKVMAEQAGPLYDMMQSLDERYGLLDEKDMEYLNEHPIGGMKSYGEYTGVSVNDTVSMTNEAESNGNVAKEDAVQQQQAESTGAEHASKQREIPELPYETSPQMESGLSMNY